MILILSKDISDEQREHVQAVLRREGCSVANFTADGTEILEVSGKPGQDMSMLGGLAGVSRVIAKPPAFKLVSREQHPENTVVRVGDVAVGADRIVVMAGPCSIESRSQAMTVALAVKRFGAVLYRGGAFKPRSSPYAFQGLGKEGLEILAEIREQTGLRTVSEAVSAEKAELMLPYVDVLQVGARNMQNFELLKCVGRLGRPVLLKRGLSATIEEWLMSAEYILAEGNDQVILCERGIRTYEPYTRNTLDLSAIPVVKRLTHLPVIIDPSHATGIREKVSPMARAAIAAGADGLMIEVHNQPEKAFSDGPQSLLPEQFGQLMRDIHVIAPVVGKQLDFGYLDKANALKVAPPADREHASVGFMGERGSSAHNACIQYFGGEVPAVPLPSYRDVFEAVKAGRIRFAVVPLENSLTGSVHENYDLLLESDLQVVGELKLRLRFSVVAREGTPLDAIRRIFAHPDVYGQCRDFIDSQGWQLVPAPDEAAAVRLLAEQGCETDAAVAGQDAAELYEMAVIEGGIETNPRNFTRFGIVSRERLPQAERRKSLLIYSTNNQPGALFETLRLFAEAGINLVKLESRPIHGQPWEYMFYVDLEADAEAPGFQPVLEALRARTDFLRVLGSYS